MDAPHHKFNLMIKLIIPNQLGTEKVIKIILAHHLQSILQCAFPPERIAGWLAGADDIFFIQTAT